MAKIKICPICKCINSEIELYCKNCGNIFTASKLYNESEIDIVELKICPQCKTKNEKDSITCSSCGETIGEIEALKIVKNKQKELLVKKEIPKTQKESLTTEREQEEKIEPMITLLTGHNFIGEYKILEPLRAISGEADIYKVKKDNEIFILKLYRYGIEPKKGLLEEIVKISQSAPEHIIRIYKVGYSNDDKRYYEIQEYAPFQSLDDWLGEKGKLEDSAARDILRQLNRAIHFLHTYIIHRDIKPSNILIRSIKPLDIVLTNFGISSILDPKSSMRFTPQRGTTMYLAPESLSNIITKAVDYWAVGLIMIEIITGKHPFEGFDEDHIKNHLITKPVPLPEDIDSEWKDLIKGLLTRDYGKRWGYNEIERWLKGERDIPIYFESVEDIEQSIAKIVPYKFLAREFTTVKDLASSIIKEPENWVEAKKRLMRGQITKWIEGDVKNHDLATQIEDIVTEPGTDPDIALFKTIYKMDPSLPFVFKGKLLGTRQPKWDFSNLIKFLQDYFESKDNSPEELEDLIYHFFEENLFLKYLEITGDKDNIDLITNLVKKVSKIEGLSRKAVTFAMGLNGQDIEIIKEIKNNLLEKVYPHVEEFSIAQQSTHDEVTLDGEALLKIKTFTDKFGYSPDVLKERFTPKNFKLVLQEIFKGKKTNGEQVILDIFLNKLYSQYLRFTKSSTIEIKKIEDIEAEIIKFKEIYEKALAYYILKFDKSEEIRQEILEKYKDKLIDNFQMDTILNRIKKYKSKEQQKNIN